MEAAISRGKKTGNDSGRDNDSGRETASGERGYLNGYGLAMTATAQWVVLTGMRIYWVKVTPVL